jgi:hypothetical protein
VTEKARKKKKFRKGGMKKELESLSTEAILEFELCK